MTFRVDFFTFISPNDQKLLPMFELSKNILQKVSFDKRLFRKELRKSLRWLKKEEALSLKAWCLATFGTQYKDLIMDVYDSVSV